MSSSERHLRPWPRQRPHGLPLLRGALIACLVGCGSADGIRADGIPADEDPALADARPLPALADVPVTPAGLADGDLVPAGPLPRIDAPGDIDPAALVGPGGDGRPVLVAFMASWCQPCEASLPTLAALEDDVRIVIFDVDVNAIGRRKLVEKVRAAGIDAPLVIAAPFVQEKWLGATKAVPRYFFVAPTGEIAAQERGFDASIGARMPGRVARLLR